VLRLAARVGLLAGAEPAPRDTTPVDGPSLVREIARRSFVLLRNEDGLLPLRAPELRTVALIGDAAKQARVLGGGSATVFPDHVVSPLDGLRRALPRDVELVYAQGADPRTKLAPAAAGFALRSRYLDQDGAVLADLPQPNGQVQWLGELPEGVGYHPLHSIELYGTFLPEAGGTHTFAVTGYGDVELVVGGRTVHSGPHIPTKDDIFAAFMDPEEMRFEVDLAAAERVEVSLRMVPLAKGLDENMIGISFSLGHRPPTGTPDELIDEAVRAAAGADVAVVVVATTEQVESEGFDRTDLRLPGRQDELVSRVAAANPRTVVVVNTGSPVEMPWRDEVAAVLLTWFPGQEAGHALADVLLGSEEPGGRLPTTWPVAMADCPVLETDPVDGVLRYDEGVFIGYRAWERTAAEPAYWFGHGLGYTEWAYNWAQFVPSDDPELLGVLTVEVRNAGTRPGREVVQAYLEPAEPDAERPLRWLAGFAPLEAAPGRAARAEIPIPRRAAQIWDESAATWRTVPGTYRLRAGRSYADLRVEASLDV
jgi:beta-glucosidase